MIGFYVFVGLFGLLAAVSVAFSLPMGMMLLLIPLAFPSVLAAWGIPKLILRNVQPANLDQAIKKFNAYVISGILLGVLPPFIFFVLEVFLFKSIGLVALCALTGGGAILGVLVGAAIAAYLIQRDNDRAGESTSSALLGSAVPLYSSTLPKEDVELDRQNRNANDTSNAVQPAVPQSMMFQAVDSRGTINNTDRRPANDAVAVVAQSGSSKKH